VPRILGFPNPVNEVAARSVAAGVVVFTVATLALSVTAGPGWLWLSAVLAYGFLARVLTGPKLSPLGQLATRVVAPRIGRAKLVPGPPKRFAQGMGATMTLAAVVALALGHPLGTQVLLGLVVVAATLESVFALCLGCHVFALLMRVGLIPESACEACADIRLRQPQAA
jgi:hypothetical protein